ncbi:TcpE family conjugal transfer membrane protein [Bacillus sp. BA3]|uniref:TcpE family conjugal transfer membrane protein n=1 Tax=Bacillus sp. BA3 TaxID=2057910 RepID=UPI0012FEB21A|nr:TcpE family conjugal transfer membrane protein [Bacillus sp. BA3]
MREKARCYRKLWKKPITIHKLGKGEMALTFSKGLEVRQIVVALLILSVIAIFHKSINSIIPFQFQLAVYGLVPWFLAGWICNLRLDGKRLDRAILGYLKFLHNRRYSYSSNKAVYQPQMKKKQSYGQYEVKTND